MQPLKHLLNTEGKMSHIPWCKSCSRPLDLKRVDDSYIWYCGSLNCTSKGVQVKIEASKMNGATNKAKTLGLYRYL